MYALLIRAAYVVERNLQEASLRLNARQTATVVVSKSSCENPAWQLKVIKLQNVFFFFKTFAAAGQILNFDQIIQTSNVGHVKLQLSSSRNSSTYPVIAYLV